MESEIDEKSPKPPVNVCELPEREAELSAIVADSVDLTEPACMEKVMFYLEKLQAEDEAFMTVLLDNVNLMDITWEQPWYQQTKCITRPIKDNGDEEGEKFRNDSFDSSEIKRVKKNWRKFRKLYELPDTPICFARWKNKDKSRHPNTREEQVRHFVTAFLAQGLQRTLFQVYRHILSFFGGPIRGQYSPVEKQIMEICFQHNPKRAGTIVPTVLSREPRGIYKKLEKTHGITEKKIKRKKKWTLTEISELVKLLKTYNQCSLEELKNKWFDVSMWMKIQEDMDHPYILIQRFWYYKLHTQLFIKGDIKIKRLRKAILKRLTSMPYKKYIDIRWKDVAKYFPDGFTHYFIHTTAYSVLRQCPGYYSSVHLEEIIKYALEKLKNSKDRRLKTLTMDKNGEVRFVRYENMLEL